MIQSMLVVEIPKQIKRELLRAPLSSYFGKMKYYAADVATAAAVNAVGVAAVATGVLEIW
jgi:hypothetical protein